MTTERPGSDRPEAVPDGTMQAAYVTARGPADLIRHGTLPAPRPGPTDVLVRTTATTVNPVDALVRSGVFETPLPFPFVVGRDLVGTVAEAGPGAPGFAPGDRVWCNSLGHEGRQGAAAELAVVPGDRLYHLPPDVDPLNAVTVLHPGATAYLALFTHGGLTAGRTVLVGGAAGSVGSCLVTLAAAAGARVIATARPQDHAYCTSRGASAVVDYRAPDLADQVRELSPRGVDLHLDTSGANDLRTAVGLLAPRGRIVLFAGARSESLLPAGALYLNDGSVAGFVISHATTAELAEAAGAVNRLLAEGALHPRERELLPLGATAEAHARVEQGLHGRRLVLLTEAAPTAYAR